jgi:hypothetical protein
MKCPPKSAAPRILITGFPITRLHGAPLNTLGGIRVRDWALFSILPRYGVDTYLLIDRSADVSADLQSRYGQRLIRGPEQAAHLLAQEHFVMHICSATKYHEYQRKCTHVHNTITQFRVPTFAAFCYDNEDSAPDESFIRTLIGVSFTSHHHRLNWESRLTKVPAIVTTTGQVAPPLPVGAADKSVIFVGFVHNEGYVVKMARLAAADPHRSYTLISGFIRDHSRNHKHYHKMADMSARQQHALIHSILARHKLSMPSNFGYRYLPPGQDHDVLQEAAVGLDFSWYNKQSIENSKICRYLTYGIFPIAQLPATSCRFVKRFDYGTTVRFAAGIGEWLDAIRHSDSVSSLDKRKTIATEARAYFSWDNVVSEIAYFLAARGVINLE